MIYKISAVNMPTAFNRGGRLITMGIDGVHGLIADLTDFSDLTIVERYYDSELPNLLELPEWKNNI